MLLETAWVLQSAYDFQRHDVADALRRLGGLPNVLVEYAEQMAAALDLARSGMDVAHALHLAACPQAERFYTFDRQLIRHAQATSRRRRRRDIERIIRACMHLLELVGRQSLTPRPASATTPPS